MSGLGLRQRRGTREDAVVWEAHGVPAVLGSPDLGPGDPGDSDAQTSTALTRLLTASAGRPATLEILTCADIPWAMIEVDAWPDGDAKLEAQGLINRRWHELRCCDRPVPFGCCDLPYPDTPTQIRWRA